MYARNRWNHRSQFLRGASESDGEYAEDYIDTVTEVLPNFAQAAAQAPGTPLTELLRQALSFYTTFEQNRILLRINEQRLSRGLPPLDPGSLTPAVNVGVSQNVQTILWVGVLGLIGVGVLAATRR